MQLYLLCSRIRLDQSFEISEKLLIEEFKDSMLLDGDKTILLADVVPKIKLSQMFLFSKKGIINWIIPME